MSSFKRKGASKQTTATVYPGTRASSSSNLSIITSTGVVSLDDILGGGLPLSCLMLLAAPDVHSSYGELIQKYFTAQGLADGHRVYIVGQDPDSFAKDIMWFSRSSTMSRDSDEEGKAELSEKVKIAWRYEKMKPFQTIVESTDQNSETFCHNFELSSRVPKELIDDAVKSGQLQFLDLERRKLSTTAIFDEMTRAIEADSSQPLRVCIPSLGSPIWGDVTVQSILHFLHTLKSTLRKHRHACASISLAPYISRESWGGVGWTQKLGWVSDAALTLSAFSGRSKGKLNEAILTTEITGDPGLSNMFPSHHGLVHIHTVPSPHTLSAPSDRFSCLRGLSSSGENNLGFKSTRKRVIFERLHLDIEGGIGERRTTEEAKKKPKERRQVMFKSDSIDF